MDPVYADHHATTPLRPEVFEAMTPWLTQGHGNPSSLHSLGRAARRAVEEARATVARCLGAAPDGIVFTSGGTESDVLAVWGAAHAARAANPSRTEIVIGSTEHAAVREAARLLGEDGFQVSELAVDADGVPVEAEPGPTVALVSAILANNETGAVFTGLPALARAARDAGALCHTDAVQAVGKIPVSATELGVDLLSLTGHKLGGPKGTGALYVRKGVRLRPLASGGGQEKGRRGGTENVAGIVGLATAVELATRHLAAESRRLAALRDRFEERLLAACPGARVHATSLPATKRLPTASSVLLPGVDAETLLLALDLEGICASSGSACHAGTTSPSRVLLAMGIAPADARSTLRFSFGHTSSEADVDRLLDVLPRLVTRVRDALSGSEPQPPRVA